jgi:hypothetical protein
VPEATQAKPATPVRPRTLLPAAIVIAYVAAEIFLYTVHEPWRDEAQAWLVAGELRTPLDFLVIPGEGHPPLWFWLLRLMSLGLSFEQARPLMLGVAALNAVLLARLFSDRPLLLGTLLCSTAVLHYWGFYFRPYTLIVSCVAGALLLDRAGRRGATWLVALACGLHFYSGFLLAFWLIMELRRGTRMRQLAGPAAAGAVFGLSAILSAAGNPAGELDTAALPLRTLGSFAALFPVPPAGMLANAAIIVIVLAFGLRRSPVMLASLVVLLVLFSGFAALIYGFAPWHIAFALLMVLVAWSFDRAAPGWVLALLLVPQDMEGIRRAVEDTQHLASPDEVAWTAVAADAGARFDPAHNLVSWQDFLLTPAAARHGIRYISGNSGEVIGAVDWRTRRNRDLDADLLETLATPYWLVCDACEAPLAAVRAAGRKATEILPPQHSLIEPIAAYRID